MTLGKIFGIVCTLIIIAVALGAWWTCHMLGLIDDKDR